MSGRDLAQRRRSLQRRGPASYWSQRAVADRLGLSVDTVVRLEAGKNVKLSTFRDVETEIARGERVHTAVAKDSLVLSEPGAHATTAIHAELRALAARIFELARTLDAPAAATARTTPDRRRRRVSPHR